MSKGGRMSEERKVRQGSVYLDPAVPAEMKTVRLLAEQVVDGRVCLAGETVSVSELLAAEWIQNHIAAEEGDLWEAPAPVALQEVRLRSQQVIGGSVRMRDDIVSVPPDLAQKWIAAGEADAMQSPTPETPEPRKRRKAE